MFTGIIEEVGRVVSVKAQDTNITFGIDCSFTAELKVDQSIAHNGVCLTVININGSEFDVDIVNETLEKSNLNSIAEASKINLERAMRYNQRVSGHFVQGHVDTQAKILDINKTNEWTEIEFEVDSDYKKYCIYKKV